MMTPSEVWIERLENYLIYYKGQDTYLAALHMYADIVQKAQQEIRDGYEMLMLDAKSGNDLAQ